MNTLLFNFVKVQHLKLLLTAWQHSTWFKIAFSYLKRFNMLIVLRQWIKAITFYIDCLTYRQRLTQWNRSRYPHRASVYRSYSIRSTALNWLCPYLTDRKQSVQLNGDVSTVRTLKFWVLRALSLVPCYSFFIQPIWGCWWIAAVSCHISMLTTRSSMLQEEWKTVVLPRGASAHEIYNQEDCQVDAVKLPAYESIKDWFSLVCVFAVIS